VIALPALPTRPSPTAEDDDLGLDELLDLCADPQVAPRHPVLWALRARTHAYTQMWRYALTSTRGVGGSHRAW
jgi:hypothetical protein